MKKFKNYRLLLLLLFLLLLIAIVAVSIYFGTAKSNNTPDSSKSIKDDDEIPEGLMSRTTDGRIILLNLKNGDCDTLERESTYGISAFDYYGNKTIYYGTAKAYEPIRSSSSEYPDLTRYTANLTKTAIAVDFISEKVYVIDRNAGQLYVMDIYNKYYNVILSDLQEPKDIVMDPKRGLMFILQSTSIYQVNMDGTEKIKIVDKIKIKAMTIDRENTTIYYATKCSIKGVNYLTRKYVSQALIKQNILSLAVQKNKMFFISTSKGSNNRMLDFCLIVDGSCRNFKRNLLESRVVINLQSIKYYDNQLSDVRSPCAEDNGGCQHLCILTAANQNRYVCICNMGWQLNSDLKTCRSVTESEETLLLT